MNSTIIEKTIWILIGKHFNLSSITLEMCRIHIKHPKYFVFLQDAEINQGRQITDLRYGFLRVGGGPPTTTNTITIQTITTLFV